MKVTPKINSENYKFSSFFLPEVPTPAMPEPESKFLVPVPLAPYFIRSIIVFIVIDNMLTTIINNCDNKYMNIFGTHAHPAAYTYILYSSSAKIISTQYHLFGLSIFQKKILQQERAALCCHSP